MLGRCSLPPRSLWMKISNFSSQGRFVQLADLTGELVKIIQQRPFKTRTHQYGRLDLMRRPCLCCPQWYQSLCALVSSTEMLCSHQCWRAQCRRVSGLRYSTPSQSRPQLDARHVPLSNCTIAPPTSVVVPMRLNLKMHVSVSDTR